MADAKTAKATGKFLSESGKVAQAKAEIKKEVRAKERNDRRVSTIMNAIGLIACDSVLIYMIRHSLIDQMYGLIFVAALSAWFGHGIGGK